ncbi:helix-turn-helix domain-containing protein [Metabacillus sp. 22489]|uniref:helix-turn-helix domain-containing protein n=1 Tax=Metabacillus sp. 22489 TaxID=3453928 RepID=UPI003F87D566
MYEEITIEEFADFVKFMRKSTGMNKKTFANALGVTVTTARAWETGQKLPRDPYNVVNTIRNVVKLRIKNKKMTA